MLLPGSVSEHERRIDQLREQVLAARARGARVRLGKSTSNLFRRRTDSDKRILDVRNLQHVLSIDPARMAATAEGMTTYASLVSAALQHGLLPAVTPELKTITTGGAVSGLGIESSSFRFGLVHETVESMEVLLGTGEICRCSRSENQDLFFCLPNSYGTLGYILNLTLRLMPARRFVHLTHEYFRDPDEYFRSVESAISDSSLDFIDGTVFSRSDMYLSCGRMADEIRCASNYTYLQAYYESIHRRTTDSLTISDYIWRWDTDWFWCSRQFGAHRTVVRMLATPWLLNSATYQRIMRLSHRLMPNGHGTESIIQDVAVPVRNAAAFLRFLLLNIPVAPIWICPFYVPDSRPPLTLYPLKPGLYINFGFWDVVRARDNGTTYNREIENALAAFEGRKAFYSSSFYTREEFSTLYDQPRYMEMKRRFDPDCVFGSLYDKCVLAH